MTIRYVNWTAHAEEHFAERLGVSREWVEAAVIEPDQRFPQTKGGRRWVAHRIIAILGKSYLLRVFYDPHEDGETATIVSWYRTSRILRYWRGDL